MVRPAWLLALLLLIPAGGQAAPTARQLIEMTEIAAPAISPDGAFVAYRRGRADLSANRYRLEWYVAPLGAPGVVRRVADGGFALWSAAGVPVIEAPVWAADSRAFYFRALGDDGVQVWRAAVDGSMAQPITRDDADVERFSISNDRLTYETGASRAEILATEARDRDDGVLIDETVDPAQSLFGAVEVNGRLASQRLSGLWFGRGDRLAGQPPRRRVVDLKTFAVAEVQGAPATTISTTPNHGTLITETPGQAGAGAIRLTVGNVSTRLEAQLTDGSWAHCELAACREGRVLAAAWCPEHMFVAFTVRDRNGYYALWVWNPRSNGARQIVSIDGSLGGGGSRQPCAIGVKRAVCVVAEPLVAPRLMTFGLDDGKRTILDAPNTDLDAPHGLKVQRFEWTDAQGQAFLGRLLTADGMEGRSPLFIHYYNCDGYLRGGTGDEWPFALIAHAGIAVLCVNYPVPNSDQQDSVAEYEIATRGLRAAVDLLDRRGLIDPRRVGMGGLSFGSEVTYWTAINSDLLRAISVTSVQLEPTYYWMNSFRGRDVPANLKKVWGLGAPDETPDRWKRVSPALNVDSIRAAVLMQMPEQEFRPTIELIARLSNSTTPFELRVFANEPHILVQPRHRLAAYVRNLDWFRFWLQNVEDPDPVKAEQYRRWRVMSDRAKTGS
uniref:Atxe2 family lasso peptide isopeptidase n=1 Tax=uncultured Caulobacter sp. TaxID=158749 RepID=UPI0025F7E13F|nr:Atxe2 family lasso peptide isopeptidase [uncultured Caulobacter sp.]